MNGPGFFEVPPLSRRLAIAGEELAAMLKAGECDAATPNANFQLKCLSLQLLAWGEDLAAMEEVARPRSARETEGREAGATVVRLRPALALVSDGGLG